MSTRLAQGGLLINRGERVSFSFNGRNMNGFAGDSLASALLANDQMVVGRSFKYHRPRGFVASGAEEPNGLVNLGNANRFEPNQRATQTEVFEGLKAHSQNHFPSLEFDIGVANNWLSRFLPAGFYYKMFMYPRPFWKHVYEPFIRQSAGLGKAPTEKDTDKYEHFYAYVDVLVIGAGASGLVAAENAARSGAKVLLVEQEAHIGGRALVDEVSLDGVSGAEWVEGKEAALKELSNLTIRTRTMAAGVYDHGYVTLYERVSDHAPVQDHIRHRLWKVRAKQIITATGAIERPIAFYGNDVPGVMLASALRDYLKLYGVSVGDRTVIATNNDSAYETAIALKEAGLDVPAILDARPTVSGALPERARALGIRVEPGRAIAKVKGGKRVTGVEICLHAGEGSAVETLDCDAVAMSGGWSPVVHLWSHCGGKLLWNEAEAMFYPDLARAPTNQHGKAFVVPAGGANGKSGWEAALQDGAEAGQKAAREAGFKTGEAVSPSVEAARYEALLPVWIMPQGASHKLRSKSWLDYQNDVKVTDVQLAAREGYESVEHTKRYTTLGMATDQGKLSNINGLAVLANALSSPIPQVGTTTFRPPYTPISFSSIAGEARDALFKPTRKTPIDAVESWHDAHNAIWEPVANWRRPYTYLRDGEDKHQSVSREILNTRENVGLLDASTLGKIIVKGPDAGKFLDMLYTNMMSSLKPGKCRYGLMCNENGFLFDDGVVARLDEETFLCHTTSGGSDHVHGWMETWLQTEWWDWKVYTANVTEQFAQIAVVGPKARLLLEKLGGLDVSAETLPFMGWVDGELGGIPVRIFRISFSGELSYEIAVRAGQGRALWDKLWDAGQEFGIMPYGTEALHVMRAEKGFIMMGDETDGTVTPYDLNMGWAVSKKKEDFLGKRGLEREYLNQTDRKELVGLYTIDPKEVLPDCAHAIGEGLNEYGQKEALGHVTSTYFSPTLGRSIAMALIKGGSARMGEVLSFPVGHDKVIKAKIVDPVFYDKEGKKQNV